MLQTFLLLLCIWFWLIYELFELYSWRSFIIFRLYFIFTCLGYCPLFGVLVVVCYDKPKQGEYAKFLQWASLLSISRAAVCAVQQCQQLRCSCSKNFHFKTRKKMPFLAIFLVTEWHFSSISLILRTEMKFVLSD